MSNIDDLKFADLEPVGPQTPSGRYLRMFWHPVLRAKDLPAGRAKPIEVLGEKFTLYRGASGEPHLVGFRCAHRGTQLSLGWVEGDDLRCRYHGWKFDGTGQCNEQPNEDRPFCARVKVPSYPVREYLGLIFAYLGEGGPPAFTHYPDFDQDGVIVTDPVEIMPCNFWNRLDNDHSHVPWVHRATAFRKNRPDFLVLHQEDVTESPYGWRCIRSVRGQPDGHLKLASRSHFFMPNVYQFFIPTRAKGFEGRGLWDTKITWTVPLNDQAFAAFDVTYTPLYGEEARRYAAVRAQQQESEAETRWDLAEDVLAGKMTLEDLPQEMSAYTSFTIEDYTTQVGQGSVAGRGKENLGRTDIKLAVLRRLWLREVRAMLEGRALTQWQIPSTPLAGVMT